MPSQKVLELEIRIDEELRAACTELVEENETLRQRLDAALENTAEAGDVYGAEIERLRRELAEIQMALDVACDFLSGFPHHVDDKVSEFTMQAAADAYRVVVDATLDDASALNTLLDNVSKVYDAVTNGRISKPHTVAEAVIVEFEDYLNKLIQEEADEARTEGAREAIEKVCAVICHPCAKGIPVSCEEGCSEWWHELKIEREDRFHQSWELCQATDIREAAADDGGGSVTDSVTERENGKS